MPNTITQIKTSDGTVYNIKDDTLTNATPSADGLMSAADKTKLNGVAAGANNYSLPLMAVGTRGGAQLGFVSAGADRLYPVAISGEKLCTIIEIADTINYGVVRVGYSQNGKNYPVQLSNGRMYVNVPWIAGGNWTFIQDVTITDGVGSTYTTIPTGAIEIGMKIGDNMIIAPVITVSVFNGSTNDWHGGNSVADKIVTLYKSGSTFKFNVTNISDNTGWTGTAKVYWR